MDVPMTTTASMPFTGDFQQVVSAGNPNLWSNTAGGTKGTKRLQEVEFEDTKKVQKNTLYPEKMANNPLQSIYNGFTEQVNDYGSKMLDNMGAQKIEAKLPTPSGQDYQGGNNSLPTTSAVLPQDLTVADRMSAAPEHEIGAISNPNTLGDSLTSLIEKVHDKTIDYESQSNSLMRKNNDSAFNTLKDSFFSDYKSISGVDKSQNEKSSLEMQIEGFVEVMNSSYEYYIYSSLLVDSGKSLSQTAQTLTKG